MSNSQIEAGASAPDADLVRFSELAFSGTPDAELAREWLAKTARQHHDLAFSVAACLFHSVSAADSDMYKSALDILNLTNQRLLDATSVDDARDQQLITVLRSAVENQLALREYECGFSTAASHARASRGLLERVNVHLLPPIGLSEGAGWGSDRSWSRVVAELGRAAVSHIVRDEAFSGEQSWQDVVKQEIDPVQAEFFQNIASGYYRFIGEQFDMLTRDSSVTWRNSDEPDDVLNMQVMHLEFIGDIAAIASRGHLGALRLLRSTDRGSSDALSLLRHSQESKSFAQAAQFLRAEGPVHLLRNEAVKVLTLRDPETWRPTDIQALAFGADFLAQDEADRAFQAALYFFEAVGIASSYRFRLRPLIEAMSALAARSERSDDFARILLQSLRQGDMDQITGEAYASGLRALDWTSVSDLTRNDFQTWLNETGDTSNEVESVRLALTASIASGSTPSVSKQDLTLGRIAEIINLRYQRQSFEIEDDLTVEVTDYLEGTLSRIRTEAARGVIGYGGYNAASLAVVFLTIRSSDRLWSALTDFLIDDHIPRNLKSDALERLAFFPPELPTSVTSRLRSSFEELLNTRPDNFTQPSASPLFAKALTLGLSRHLATDADLLRYLTRLASARVPLDRIEAAHALAAGASSSGEYTSSWRFTLAVQMSRDEDALVRANAGYALTKMRLDDPQMERLQLEIIKELVDEAGVVVPLRCIEGLLGGGGHLLKDDDLVTAVAVLSTHSASRLLRGMAAQLVQGVRQTE